MAGMWHVRRILLTAGLAVGATAAAIDTPSAPVEAATTTCGPFGTLKTYQLNDRCNYGLLDLSLVTDAVVVDVLDGVGLFATLTRCTGQWLSSAAVLAMPDELLVAASDPEGLDEAVAEVSARLDGSVVGVTPLNAFVATLSLRGGTLDDGVPAPDRPDLAGTRVQHRPQLPRAGPSDQLLPARRQPGPGGCPEHRPRRHRSCARRRLTRRPPGASAGVTVMGPLVDYDGDGNGFVDEDHGHGVFVASLIKQAAPSAHVVWPARQRDVCQPRSGGRRWCSPTPT